MKYIITESQRYVLLMETLSPKFRRRLTFDNMVEEMESIVEYQLETCSFKTASDFVAEACDMFVNSFLEEDEEVSSRDRDSLYYYAVDVFEPYLVKQYNENCRGKDSLNESKDTLQRKIKILKKYTEEQLSEKDWFNGLDIKLSSYQTAHRVPHGRNRIVSIPYLIFEIDTKGIPKSLSYNDMINLDNEVMDIVVPLFTSLFPMDENDNMPAAWETKFDLHL